jgi:hypothetical protein
VSADERLNRAQICQRFSRLSDLQRTILRTALSEYGHENPNDVRSAALAAYYGWTRPHYPHLKGWQQWGRFDRRAIGRNRYNAGQVALSKALGRLEDRGLVERRPTQGGVWLTAEGVEVARYLREETPPCPR